MKSQQCQNFILYGEIYHIFDQRHKNDQIKRKKIATLLIFSTL